jgi:uncharacterized protein (DUF1800 family)
LLPQGDHVEVNRIAIPERLRQEPTEEPDVTDFIWDRRRASHLYRRAGFGATAAELDLAVSAGRHASVARLVDFEDIPTTELDKLLASPDFDFSSEADDDHPYDQFLALRRWWFLRLIYTPRPLEEKITLFWHGHFATSIDKVGYNVLMYRQNQIFRSLGMSKFKDLLHAVSRDPAMLIWLDNDTNVKDAPNENFAREVMELFTLGRGNYTQKDVTEAARAFTGWTIDGDTLQFTFDTDSHDDGVKSFLGHSGKFTGDDICAILADRPEAAAFIGDRLSRFFLGQPPRTALALRLHDVYFATGGQIRELVRAILLSDDFGEAADHSDEFKSPMEFLVGGLRSLSSQTDASSLGDYAALAGQAMYEPPNVAGWKAGASWINTGTYFVRMNFANALSSARTDGDGYGFTWNTNTFFEGRHFVTPDGLINFVADRLNMPRVSDPLRAALKTYLAAGGVAFSWSADFADQRGRGLLHLMMASPDYQLQ